MHMFVNTSLLFISLYTICESVIIQKNNVCRTWSGYWDENKDTNPDCFYNEDMYMDVPELLKKYFGHYETHEISTEDGYFITTFRITRKNPKGIILLRHPATTDSICWIIQGYNSQALYFWERGFELWMTNTRGTDFSTKHINLTVHDYSYWNFGFHDIAIYDLRASLKYIYERSNNKKIIVIGHSMGSTESIIYASMFPVEAAKYIHVFALMTPSTTFEFSRVKFFGSFVSYLEEYTKNDTIGVILNKGSLISRIIRNICPRIPDLCITLYSFFGAGWSSEAPNKVEAALIFNQITRALSVKSAIHYAQLMSSGRFQMYDYGTENLQVYGSIYPPEYPVENILAPIFLVIGSQDDLAPEKDAEAFYKKLSKSANIFGKLNVLGMNHLDPIIGERRKEKVYDKLLTLLYELK